jgi:hypothetical protein
MPEDGPESRIHSYDTKLDEILAIVKRIEANQVAENAPAKSIMPPATSSQRDD